MSLYYYHTIFHARGTRRRAVRYNYYYFIIYTIVQYSIVHVVKVYRGHARGQRVYDNFARRKRDALLSNSIIMPSGRGGGYGNFKLIRTRLDGTR